MKKFRADDYWFDISSGGGVNGRAVRYYSVRCKKCGAVSQYHATMLSDPALRKHFSKQGWDIGKHRHAHLCPECCVRRKPPQDEPKPKPPPRIDQIWDSMNEDQRAEFIVRHIQAIRTMEPLVRAGLAVTAGIIAVGTPVADNVRVIEDAPPNIDEPLSHDVEQPNDDEAAEWWKELRRTIARNE